MTDIATISLRVNTGELEKGSQALDKFQQTADKASKAADGVGQSTGKMAASGDQIKKASDYLEKYNGGIDAYTKSLSRRAMEENKVGDAVAFQSGELEKLLGRINPLNKAFGELDKIAQQLSQAKELKLIDEVVYARYQAILDSTTDKLYKAEEALTEEGREKVKNARTTELLEESQKKLMQSLNAQAATFKASKSDIAEYRAAQLGISEQAAPIIASIREQEKALEREANQKRIAAIQSRSLKQAIKEMEAAERAATLEAKRADDSRKSFVKSLSDQANAIGKTRTEILELKAAEMGVSAQAAPFIAKLREQDNAWKTGAISAGQYRQAMRMLPAQFTDIATSIAGGMPLWMVLMQQGGQIKDSFGGIGNTAKAMLSFINPLNVAIGIAGVVFGGLAISVYSAKKEIAEATKSVKETLGMSGDYAEKLALNIRLISEASGDSIKSISELFISTKDGADGALEKMLSVGISYQDARDKVDIYKGASNFTGLNSAIEAHKMEVLGIKNAWSSAAEEVRNYYTGADKGKHSFALGGAIDPIVAIIERAKQMRGDITKATIDGNLATKEAVDWIQKEYIATDRVAGAENRLKEARDKSRKIAFSGDVVAIANAQKLVALREKEVEEAKKHQERNHSSTKEIAYRDDSATKILADSKRRLASLTEQYGVSEKMTEQERRLVEFNQQIADLKSKKILTADQQSILNRSTEIKSALELEASESRRLENQKKLSEFQKVSAAYIVQQQQSMELARKNSTVSSREGQFNAQLAQLRIGYENNPASKLTGAEHDAAEQFYRDQVKAATASFKEQNALRDDWSAGVQRGFAEFTDDATNAYGQVSRITQGAFQGMSMSITDFLVEGKNSFSDFFQTFLKGIAQMMVQMAMLNTMKGAFGGTAVGSFLGLSGGGYVPAFDTGGYTGDGGIFEPKGVVHGGEFVFTKAATQALGVGNLYALMRGAQGYAEGGIVGKAPMASIPALMPGYSSGGAGITVSMGDVVIGGGNQQQPTGQAPAGDAIMKQLKPAIVATVSEQANKPGTPLWNAINGKR